MVRGSGEEQWWGEGEWWVRGVVRGVVRASGEEECKEW